MIEKLTVHFPDGNDRIFYDVWERSLIYKLDHIWIWEYVGQTFKSVEISEDKTEIWVEYVSKID